MVMPSVRHSYLRIGLRVLFVKSVHSAFTTAT
jgi:hypothetical protein